MGEELIEILDKVGLDEEHCKKSRNFIRNKSNSY